MSGPILHDLIEFDIGLEGNRPQARMPQSVGNARVTECDVRSGLRRGAGKSLTRLRLLAKCLP